MLLVVLIDVICQYQNTVLPNLPSLVMFWCFCWNLNSCKNVKTLSLGCLDLKHIAEEELEAERFGFHDSVNFRNLATCEQCGFCGPRSVFSSLRFCSLSCARKYAISHSKRSRTAGRSRLQTGIRKKRLGYHRNLIYHKSELSEDFSFQVLWKFLITQIKANFCQLLAELFGLLQLRVWLWIA